MAINVDVIGFVSFLERARIGKATEESYKELLDKYEAAVEKILQQDAKINSLKDNKVSIGESMKIIDQLGLNDVVGNYLRLEIDKNIKKSGGR